MTEAELIEVIRAAPDDDTPRRTYAEWLVTRGDPRGELIAIDLDVRRAMRFTPERRQLARARYQLLRQHAARWLDPLLAQGAYRAQFRRGFIEVVATHSAFEVRFLGALPLLRDLTCDDPKVLTHPDAQQIEVLRVGNSGLRAIAAAPRPGLRGLHVQDPGALRQAPWLPDLRELAIAHHEPVQLELLQRLGPALERLSVQHVSDAAAADLPTLLHRWPALRELSWPRPLDAEASAALPRSLRKLTTPALAAPRDAIEDLDLLDGPVPPGTRRLRLRSVRAEQLADLLGPADRRSNGSIFRTSRSARRVRVPSPGSRTRSCAISAWPAPDSTMRRPGGSRVSPPRICAISTSRRTRWGKRGWLL